MTKKVPLTELQVRLERFRDKMTTDHPNWEMAVIISKVNMYYFTGTMQDGMFIIPRDDEASLWVKRSYPRAMDESNYPHIKPMESFREAAETFAKIPDSVFLETEVVPLALYKRMQKYFPFNSVCSLDGVMAKIRAIKSSYEIAIMERAGAIHQRVLEELIPTLLVEGISEAELAADVFRLMVKEGHQGVVRFSMFDTELIIGHVCFGESSLYPTYFNGPGGHYGLNAAVPLLGSRERKLKQGDLVFIDIGCGVEGYHTDKTMTYMFGKPLPKEAIKVHKECLDVQNRIAEMLRPGVIPANIYSGIMAGLSEDFLTNFMGFGQRRVKFLGHGIGLMIDEYPVIADGFFEPLQEGMVLALEPKKGIKDIGMVGIENTFFVTPEGGQCITGINPGLISVY